ncbi:LysR substrate-binding domain-containing protein [Burkholderia pseudomultivorans]|uniref:LysR substrate-binding domain-containing protein n=1 Tax=Burkholderia pseudomultivorans TaxID=1207504 RepID=UPI0001FD84D3|nr:LysR substrate-binding domain-containing protein [Burkholderia pseudomultivorans]AOI90441.1 LysR family transcriptional regulator [Burkholderia pseudomultivorans]EGD05617.1 LysR family transcriptional regulator [Burkholderia sp. TJI49]
MIDVKPLRYFVALAETRHFGRAAARLNLTQPPLSRQLATLEASLGVTLVERTPRNVVLTAAGERFYEDAKAILAAVRQAERNARAAAAGNAGQLTIGFTMCSAYSVLPAYARAYGAAFPEVALSLRETVSNDLAPLVLGMEVDAAIVLAGTPHPQLDSRTVFEEPLCIALPAGHPLARARRLGIERLAGEPFVMAAEAVAPGLRAAIVETCRLHGFVPDVRFEVQLQQTVLSLVDEGAGVALVPKSMGKATLPGVVFRPLKDAPMIAQQLIWSTENRNPCLPGWLDIVGDSGWSVQPTSTCY